MNIRRLITLILLAAIWAGCSPAPAVPSNRTPALPLATSQPGKVTTPSTDAKEIARAYLEAWKADDYKTMYSLLTSISQDAMSSEDFIKHYNGVASEAALGGIDYEILSSLTNPDDAQVSYRIVLHSTLVGDIIRDTVMNLDKEKGVWRVEWNDTLVLPELSGGNYLAMDRAGYTPARANIYDRTGLALVAQEDATALGFYPDQVLPEQLDTLLAEMSQLTGKRVEALRAIYDGFTFGSGWYVQLGEVPARDVESHYATLSGLSGVVLRPYKARYYMEGGIAPHLIGYVGQIRAEEEQLYLRKGYRRDDRVGQSGLEKWGEDYLAGKRGGALYVLNSQGQPVTKLAEAPAQPGQAIYSTLDRDLQAGVQTAMEGFRGAVVVLERDTGRVLTMVSSPSFDPNAFEPVNFNYSYILDQIYNDPNRPLINRATLGQYPLGSVFKTVTMAAALESGQYHPWSEYQCGYLFTEVPGLTLNDWTYEYYLQDHKTAPSGLLDLSGALIRSCNPWFWHIGYDFYKQGLTGLVADMARGFGLASPTGINGIDEETGNIAVPGNEVEATNQAIGQGDVLVTPLQVASFMAAVGNGGKLYRPQVVEKIAPPGGAPTYQFQPEVRGQLPVSPENLEAIQQALVGVIRSDQPRGTAWHMFTGLDIDVAGKTGTATTSDGAPHAWFAGYSFEGRADRPDIAIAVVIENIGEGSVYAAPVFRRVVELYFNQYLKRYPWETELGVTSTPSPDLVGTPAPQGNTNP